MTTEAADAKNPRQQAAAQFVEACRTTTLKDIKVISEPGARLVVNAQIPNFDGVDGAIEILRRPDDRFVTISHGSQLHYGSMFTDEAPAYQEDGTERVKAFNAAFESVNQLFLAAEGVVNAAAREAETDAAALLSACAAEISTPEKQ
jgi:hypothetical protein